MRPTYAPAVGGVDSHEKKATQTRQQAKANMVSPHSCTEVDQVSPMRDDGEASGPAKRR